MGNKDVVRRLVEFVSADLRMHPGTPGTAPDTVGLEGLRTAFERFRTTFPDLHITLEEMVGEGELVAGRWTATGTHSGELACIAPTGTAVRWSGTDMYRIADGSIVEWWRNDDFVWLLHQLGRELIPPPG